MMSTTPHVAGPSATSSRVTELETMLKKQREASRRQIQNLHEEMSEVRTELNRLKREISRLGMDDLFFEKTDERDVSEKTMFTNRTKPSGEYRLKRIDGAKRMKVVGSITFLPSTTIAEAHGGKNVLSVRLCRSRANILASGGGDHCVRVFSRRNGKLLSCAKLPAPVLSLDWGPPEHCGTELALAASCMDGSVHLLCWQTVDEGDDENGRLRLICSALTLHTNYVTSVRFSPGGSYLATASNDRTAMLFSVKKDALSDESKAWEDVFTAMQRYHLETPVVDVAFLIDKNRSPASTVESCRLIVAERSSVYLHVVTLPSKTVEDVNVNEKDDTHLSFSILAISPSPDGNTVCIATDSDQIVLLDLSTGEQMGSLVGHRSGEYAQPSVCWDPSGRYVFSTSQNDAGIYVWNVITKRLDCVLKKHTKQVRSIDVDVASRGLVSGSYDKSVCEWTAVIKGGEVDWE